MNLRRSVTVALLAWAFAQHANAMNYVVIGRSMTGNLYSLDFDSVKRDGKLVSYTARNTVQHGPPTNFPANWDHDISTTLVRSWRKLLKVYGRLGSLRRPLRQGSGDVHVGYLRRYARNRGEVLL
jgi:hypothetical protein